MSNQGDLSISRATAIGRATAIRRFVLATVLAAATAGGGFLGAGEPSAPLHDAPLYERRDTWAETMRATRANYLRFRQSENARSAGPRMSGMATDLIPGDGPGQQLSVSVAGARWLHLATVLEQGGGNCHIWGEARLVASDGSATRLGDLKPFSIRVGWGQLLVDKNWQNQPLQIGQRKFDHGIWVHADSDVYYPLDGKFERFEAWVGMDAARPIGAARFKVQFDDPDVLPSLWQQIAADFPAACASFVDDLGNRNRNHLQWFADAVATRCDESAIQRALGDRHTALRAQLAALQADKPPSDDPRWLDLYRRACRLREGVHSTERIWLGDLRRLLENRFTELATSQTPVEDPQWDALLAQVDRIGQTLSPAPTIELSSLAMTIDTLRRAMPNRMQGLEQLAARQAAGAARWSAVLSAVASGDPTALAQLCPLADEIQAFRRSLLLAVRGMPEFLAAPAHAGLEREWREQFASLQLDLRNRGRLAQLAAETHRGESLVADDDRDPLDIVLRRADALLNDLRRMPDAPRLDDWAQELAEIRAAAAAIDPRQVEARYVAFADACRVRRQIALRNPLLSFTDIVFIKRHRALFNHMCDQYYGMAATPGGGLYVLEDAFGLSPRVRDVLADAVVPRGRLAGQRLSGGSSKPPSLRFDGMGNLSGEPTEGGSFLSPDLSCDGRQLAFAYVECRGDTEHRHHTNPAEGHWDAGRCYHIFTVGVDGSGLAQLTDGGWNDFDPCWLPNGRIAFISERRGGYLRCGRVCPTYTLYDMAPDGGDITCLSFHETNEWHPSVTNDGLIVWTRWDYVDRHGCTAHAPWVTTLDGRDPRPVHGNYAPRNLRPDMELDCRAIPGSERLIATAAPHHGQAYGSLILIDPRAPDDDAMGPVRRITPEVGFPESQGGAQVYGTPWALSEDYYLCVYDAAMQADAGIQGGRFIPGNYGIYLVDAFGNRELIYRDPEIGCLSPIPLRARPMPRVAVELTQRGPETDPAQRPSLAPSECQPEGTLALVNVYEGLKPWPAGTQITHLRVLQLLPMTVPSGEPPHETALRQAWARDSVVPVRYVLGTVPVEADGSAHFTAPANRELFFQALDAQGLAVQSMRSATHLRAGEHLMCVGCHTSKSRSPLPTMAMPLALARPPSRIEPDVDGSNPFSYPRLVQPVLDRHCVECHADQADRAPNLGREPLVGRWYASYANLVDKYGFTDYADGYRTLPGRFGARASKLYALLQQGHYDVNLPADDLHRLTLWLDCASMFYGVYEREGAEAQLRGEIVRPTLE